MMKQLSKNGKTIRVLFMDLSQFQGRIKSVCVEMESEYLILVDENQSEQGKRFAIGHELAHIFLNHFKEAYHTAKLEREANRAAWKYYRLYKQVLQEK